VNDSAKTDQEQPPARASKKKVLVIHRTLGDERDPTATTANLYRNSRMMDLEGKKLASSDPAAALLSKVELARNRLVANLNNSSSSKIAVAAKRDDGSDANNEDDLDPNGASSSDRNNDAGIGKTRFTVTLEDIEQGRETFPARPGTEEMLLLCI
jgi:hypothetical protein